MKIAIVGTGYVGLVTGVSLATFGHRVFCIEINQERLQMIQKGKTPIYEPGLERLFKKVLGKSLFITDNLEEGVSDSNIIIITVGTPTVNNKINLTAIKKAAKQIGKALAKSKKYQVVVVKSTVLPGTTNDIIKPLLEKHSGKSAGKGLGLCMNPEFLREGSALNDALKPDRIVIGQLDEKSGKEFAKVYAKIKSPLIFTNLWTAELTKYAANALFATLISYSNEIARISEAIGNIDVVDVWKGVHLDRRLSPTVGTKRIKPGLLSYIFSGCGYGGSCFPKDTKALASLARQLKVPGSLIESVIDINLSQPHRILLLLKRTLGKNLKGKKVAILGLTFKAKTDDLRESAAFPIIDDLLKEGAIVAAHDPMAYKSEPVSKQLTGLRIRLAKSVTEAIQGSEAVVLVTAWEEYVKLTPDIFKLNMKKPLVVDGRRIYDKQSFLKAGVTYTGIGLS